jgi:hypothetical protein
VSLTSIAVFFSPTSLLLDGRRRPPVSTARPPLPPQAKLVPVAFDAELFEDAMELPIIKGGKATEYGDGMIVVHSLVRDLVQVVACVCVKGCGVCAEVWRGGVGWRLAGCARGCAWL